MTENAAAREMPENYEIRKDCFAYAKNGRCVALKDLFCKREACKFYQPGTGTPGLMGK